MTAAATPLTIVSGTGSAALSFRVRLLSMPQQMQAATISAPPQPTVIAAPSAGQDSTSAPASMAMAPANRRRSTFSRKKIQAIAMVARPSVLRRSEPALADANVSPAISSAGPRRPPKRRIKPSHGRSRRRNGASTAHGSGLHEHLRHGAGDPGPEHDPD